MDRDEDLRPEQGPPAPEDPPLEPMEPDDEFVGPPHKIDPALMYIVVSLVTLFGLTSFPAETRYVLVWTALALIGVLAIIVDKVAIEPPTLRDILLGIGFAGLVTLPILAVGAAELKRISVDIFGSASTASVFHILAFTMPMAEAVFFRGALHSARGPLFAGIAAGVWAVILFFPQLNVLKFPLVALVIGMAFVFINALYSYIRQRAGFYASWTCQITVNMLLLFASRFVTL
jgi:hypothetical protein